MKVGDWLVLTEEHYSYKKGHKFKLVAFNRFDGFTMEDVEGNVIENTRFIIHKFKPLSEWRNDKLNDLGI